MQASGSFENARTGRRRPNDLLAFPSNTDEVAMVSSPSFNAHHATAMRSNKHSAAAAPPAAAQSSRHSHNGSTSSPLILDGMPPTPITAGLYSSPSAVRLPSVSELFGRATVSPRITASGSAASFTQTLPTPPDSSEIPSSPRFGGEGGEDCHIDDDIEQFSGPRPQWLQDQAKSTFVDVDRPTLSRRISEKGAPPVASTASTSRVSPRTFNDIVQDGSHNGVTGLGLAPASSSDEQTPRIGSMGGNILGLMTPTQADYSRIPRITERAPRAPALQQEGRFASTVPSSPIHPPLSNWNIHLNFDRSERFRAPDSDQDVSAPTSVPMQREEAIKVDWGMPTQAGVRGLGVSLDGSMEFPEASSSRVTLPVSALVDETLTPADSTGLTPTLDRSRISKISPADVMASPPLRSQSKKRSDLVRRQAEAAVAVGRSNRRSPLAITEGNGTEIDVEASVARPSLRKSALSERDVNVSQSAASVQGKSLKSTKSAFSIGSAGSASPTKKSAGSAKDAAPSSSPWGIFRLKEEGWKALAPPGGGKPLGSHAVSNAGAQHTARKQKSSSSLAASRPSSKNGPPVSSSAPVGKKVLGHASSHSSLGLPHIDRRGGNKENVAPGYSASRSHRPASSPSVSYDGSSQAPRSAMSSSRPSTHMARPMNTPVGGGGVGGSAGGSRRALR